MDERSQQIINERVDAWINDEELTPAEEIEAMIERLQEIIRWADLACAEGKEDGLAAFRRSETWLALKRAETQLAKAHDLML